MMEGHAAPTSSSGFFNDKKPMIVCFSGVVVWARVNGNVV